jgi:hypothetical protein
MNPLDKLKDLRREGYVKGQEAVAREVATQDLTDRQAQMRQAAKVAAETIDLANELAKDGDPHKQRLAALIKDAAVGVADQLAAGPVPQEGREAIEETPFSSSGSSQPSATSLPGSTPKALPHEAPETPPKRGRGRPRKHPQS